MSPNAIIDIVAGPTASGKSAFALEKAEQTNGTIINADSMQIYDALHVLTAQPPEDDLRAAPHKLYSVLKPHERCTPQRWRDMAEQEIRHALENGCTPIIVGGTGLYIKALIEGFSPIPDIPDDIRKTAIQTQKELGNPAFHHALAEFDTDMAERLNPNDTQRLVRAWEVFKATGRSLSYWQALPPSGPPQGLDFRILLVNPERTVLHERCNRRFDNMIDQGILDEVKTLDRLIAAGKVAPDAPVTNALGFTPLQGYLHGHESLENAKEKAKAQTRQYAKRQVTWFRHQLPKAITETI